MKHTSPHRRGMAIITVMVAMAVLTVILAVITLQVVEQRRVVSQRHRQLQADWLARAGLEHAAARLLASPAAFKDDKQELLPDTKLSITVEKEGEVYVVTADAKVGIDGTPVARSASVRFRRSESGGMVRLTVEK
jgi:type II secretory pathway component PulK